MVIAIIGGVNETLMVKGQNNIPYKNVSVENQKRALAFLSRYKCMANPELVNESRINFKNKEKGALKRIRTFNALL